MIDERIRQRFSQWWERKNDQYPLVHIVSKKNLIKFKDNLKEFHEINNNSQLMDRFINADVVYKREMILEEMFSYMGDAFHYINMNLGPGSMAAYLKSQPGFSDTTVWYHEVPCRNIDELSNISHLESTNWWGIHLNEMMKLKKLVGDFLPIAIPDIVENLDIVSAIRGPQNLCYDLYDNPEGVKRIVNIVDDAYFYYYDEFYNLLKMEDESSVYTAFNIWGTGKTAKIQCDFSAMISCEQFDEFVIPSIKKQTKKLNNVLYHLDGKDAIRHIDSIVSVEEINAINWTPGDGQDDGGSEIWFPLYDKVINANKGLWIGIGQGPLERRIECARRIQKRYGNEGLYFNFGIVECESDAEKLLRELGCDY